MFLVSLFADLAVHLQFTQFHQSARHLSHPTAFTRHRKLPLTPLMALLLSGMRMSVQAELDTFFTQLMQSAQLLRHVSEQAFAQTRAKLALTAIPELNNWAHCTRRTGRIYSSMARPALGRSQCIDYVFRSVRQRCQIRCGAEPNRHRIVSAQRLLAKQTYRHREQVSKPRMPGPKSYKPMTQKS